MATKKPKKAVEKKEKPQEVIVSYKGFDQDMRCRDYQYAIGGSYEHNGDVAACNSGFHACEYPLHVLRYYSANKSRFALVEQSGAISRHGDDSKIASSRINVKAEINIQGLIKAAIQYTMDRCTPAEGATSDNPNTVVKTEGKNRSATASGDSGAATASGNYGAATASGDSGAATASGDSGAATASGNYGAATASGNYGAATASGYSGAATASGYSGAATASGNYGAATASGNYGAATASGNYGAATASGNSGAATASGNYGAATASGYSGAATASGNYGAATASGNYGAATASGYSGAATASGRNGKARGKNGCALFLVNRDSEWKINQVGAAIVGQNDIKEDVWYRLNDSGEFVEAA
jgi:hypothetical protein